MKHYFWCFDCNEETIVENTSAAPICSHCGSENVRCTATSIECTCGEEVFVPDFTNECPKCGKLYNSFGQELAPKDEWDSEERYDAEHIPLY